MLDVLSAGLAEILVYCSRGRLLRRGLKSHSTEEQNTYGLPDGESIAKELALWYRRQRKEILKYIPYPSEILPVVLPVQFPSLTGRVWVEPMAHSMVPRLAPLWEDSYRAAWARIERKRAVDEGIVNPHLRTAIEQQAFAFCRKTNESTSLKLEDALAQLKDELINGLVDQGDSIRELTRRIRDIFDSLEESSAKRIAQTEASRSVHTAQEMAAVESGVVIGKELLVSSDACPICQKVATEAKQVRLGQAFAIIGNHPDYATIMMPPIHPNCRCSAVDILLPEYGGPADVEWAATLVQPQQDLGESYTPPEGKEVPEPEPERIGR